MRIKCITTFDITATGVRSNFNANRIPFHDSAGNAITDIEQWTRSRKSTTQLGNYQSTDILEMLAYWHHYPGKKHTRWYTDLAV